MKKILLLFMTIGIPFFMSAQCVVNFSTTVDANLLIIKWDCTDTSAVFAGQMSPSKNGPFETAGSSGKAKKFAALYPESEHFWFRVRYSINGKYYYSKPIEIWVP